MSFRPTPITEQLNEYLEDKFSACDDFLVNLNERAAVKGMPAISISGSQGKFLQIYLKSINAKHVLEIGGLAGFSAIIMARALPADGKLICVERSPEYADFIRFNVKSAGLENKVEVICTDGREFVKTFKPEFPLDFVFVDADKPGYFRYLTALTPHIRKGGIFAADNAFAFGFLLDAKPERDPNDVRSIVAFNEAFRTMPEYDVCMVPIGDGIIMGVKK